MLAVLLLRPNRPVSANEIVDAVWGDDPPANGANVVQKHVSGLRSLFEPERAPRVLGQLLRLTEAGYVLQVEPSHLDTDQFDGCLRQARTAREEGDPAAALRALHQGLRLWRGPALAGLSGGFFDAERRRLTEIQTAALEESMEAELALGRLHVVIPELINLVAKHPLRERLRYLLMLAFARSGQQAQALAVYREARAYLIDELGIEPGDELQELHQRILAAEAPGPAPTSPAPTSPGPQVPVVTVTAHIPSPPPPAPAPPPQSSFWRWAGTFWPALVPLLSMGFFSWLPPAYAAVRLRSGRLYLATALYIMVFIAVCMVAILPRNVANDLVFMVVLVGQWTIGTLQGIWLRARLNGAAALKRDRVDPVTAEEVAGRARRQLASELLSSHPVVARDLGIGRPDLPRHFDDGGLVDINAVPVEVFASLPGVTPESAQYIVSERQRIGSFTSVDDLAGRGLLPPRTFDSVRDRLIALAPADAAMT